MTEPEEKAFLDDLTAKRKAYTDVYFKTFKLFEEGKFDEGRLVFKNEAPGPLVTYMKNSKTWWTSKQSTLTPNAKTAEDAADVLRTLLVVVTLVHAWWPSPQASGLCAASPCRWVVNRMWPAK